MVRQICWPVAGTWRRSCAVWLVATALTASCFDLASDRSDLAADPGLTGPCYAGPATQIGVGECRQGFTINYETEDGVADVCLGMVLASPETCNGLDDDCDGATDNQGVCATDTLAGLGSAAQPPFIYTAPDRVGPALVKHPHDGALWSCGEAEGPDRCAERFVTEFAGAWGGGDGTGISFAFQSQSTAREDAHVSVTFQQQFSDPAGLAGELEVVGGGLVVHVQLLSPHIIRSVSGLVFPVRADLPTGSLRLAEDSMAGLADASLSDTPPELVVLPLTVAAADSLDAPPGTPLPVEEQEQVVAWQLELGATTERGPEWVWVSAAAGGTTEPLARRSRRFEDVTVYVSGEEVAVWSFPEPRDDAPVAGAAATAAAEAALALLYVVEVAASPGSMQSGWHEVSVDLHPDHPGCVGDGGLGFVDADAPGAAIVCQVPAALGEESKLVFSDVVRHELAHSVLLRTHEGPAWGPFDDEAEAVQHGVVEGLAEMAECASGGSCQWRHGEVDLTEYSNPAGGCDAPIEVDIAEPSVQLCAGDSVENRRVIGHALSAAACTMAGTCSASECSFGPASDCGSSEEHAAASLRLARIVIDGWARGYMPGLRIQADFGVGLRQACLHLADEPAPAGSPQVTPLDCARLSAAFAQVGLTTPCANPVLDVCDGQDNDCDGYTDNPPGTYEHFSLTRPCTGWDDAWIDGEGPCRRGVETCQSSGPSTATWSGPWACSADHVGGQVEACNAVDDDCDGDTDEGLATLHRVDTDGDDHWSELTPAHPFCPDTQLGAPGAPPSEGWRPVSELAGADCDDTDAEVHPGAADICNGRDDNCSGEVDEGLTEPYRLDFDGDGYWFEQAPAQAFCEAGEVGEPGAPPSVEWTPVADLLGGDCNDTDTEVHPAASEVCNGADDNCDQVVDEGLTVEHRKDFDGDLHWPPSEPPAHYCPGLAPTESGPPPFWVPTAELLGEDCNDNDDQIYVDAPEDCDGTDSDCDGDPVAAGCPCAEGDPPLTCGVGGEGYGEFCQTGQQHCFVIGGEWSWGPCLGEKVGSPEVCNGLDDDCDGTSDEDLGDLGSCGPQGEASCVDGEVTCGAACGDEGCVVDVVTVPFDHLCDGTMKVGPLYPRPDGEHVVAVPTLLRYGATFKENDMAFVLDWSIGPSGVQLTYGCGDGATQDSPLGGYVTFFGIDGAAPAPSVDVITLTSAATCLAPSCQGSSSPAETVVSLTPTPSSVADDAVWRVFATTLIGLPGPLHEIDHADDLSFEVAIEKAATGAWQARGRVGAAEDAKCNDTLVGQVVQIPLPPELDVEWATKVLQARVPTDDAAAVPGVATFTASDLPSAFKGRRLLMVVTVRRLAAELQKSAQSTPLTCTGKNSAADDHLSYVVTVDPPLDGASILHPDSMVVEVLLEANSHGTDSDPAEVVAEATLLSLPPKP